MAEKVDTRQRFTVTTEVTLKAETPEEAREMVEALLTPLPMVKPFSVSYPPAVTDVRVRDGKALDADEEAAFNELLGNAGIEPEAGS